MADQAVAEDLGGDVEVEATKKKGLSGKKLVLFIVLPLLLIIGGAAGAYFAGLLDPLLGVQEEMADQERLPDVVETTPSAYYDLPEMLVNLNTGGGRKASYLKITISLELSDEEHIIQLEQVLPRVIDNFQVYLRELRVDDLKGSAGLQRLREELLLRVSATLPEGVVRDVLFKEMLVQ
ncbi:MAG: flagellar basal body-associated FliL family protein [Pseudomonadota bacterium]